ncbi:hypothetical protein J6590_044743 [Homalodisca vitripennis]|nr:hypothetical protein J6590_044743 [Homalodisca vitripennis]
MFSEGDSTIDHDAESLSLVTDIQQTPAFKTTARTQSLGVPMAERSKSLDFGSELEIALVAARSHSWKSVTPGNVTMPVQWVRRTGSARDKADNCGSAARDKADNYVYS